MARYMLMCAGCIVLIGCSDSTRSKATNQKPQAAGKEPMEQLVADSTQTRKAVKKDPVSSFSEIASNLRKKVAASTTVVYDQISDQQGWTKSRFKLSKVSFDVKKTDSLVSPLVGIIMCGRSHERSPFFQTKEEAQAYAFATGDWQDNDPPPMQLRYAWQNEMWVRTAILEQKFNLDAIGSPTAPKYVGPFEAVKIGDATVPAWRFFFGLLE
jgi:hypothetical protein